MKSKFFNLIIVALSLMACKSEDKRSDQGGSEEDTVALEKRARVIHDRVITLDTHCDINLDNFTADQNYTQPLNSQVNLPKMEVGGLDVAWFIVYTDQESLTDSGFNRSYKNAIDKFDAIHRLCDEYASESIGFATNSQQVKDLVAAGKKVAMIGVENGYPIGTDLERVEEFYKRGARYMSLAHNGHSQLSDSNTGEADGVWLHNGLSDLGRQAVTEMNRLGMMIDASHPSKEAIRQMIQLSKAPIIASHSSARALCDHSRNLDDEQLEWFKQNGGVVQAVAFSSYLNTDKHNKREAFEKEILLKIMESKNMAWLERKELKAMSGEARDAYYNKLQSIIPEMRKEVTMMDNAPEAVNVQDFVDHIDYLVDFLGIDHVGISSDFDGGGGIEGWRDASETFNVTLELVKRGYAEADIEKMWSGNLGSSPKVVGF